MWKMASVLALLLVSPVVILGCSGGKMDKTTENFTSCRDIPESTWRRLSQKTIFFGHQSVGFNVIDGIKDLMRDNPQIQLKLIEITAPNKISDASFAHSRIGKNRDPNSKIRDFANFIGNQPGTKIDIAFMKLCYVDLNAGTDVDAVYRAYKDMIDNLTQEYPKITFVHFTVPLTTVQTGFTAFIKGMIGRQVRGYDENIKREELNQKIRKDYGGKGTLFDLAMIESTHPDGKRSSFDNNGKTYYSLVSDYTEDGGHLNTRGREIVAEKLLVLLANLTN